MDVPKICIYFLQVFLEHHVRELDSVADNLTLQLH